MSDQWRTFWQRLAIWALCALVAGLSAVNSWALTEIIALKSRASVTESRVEEIRETLREIRGDQKEELRRLGGRDATRP